MFSSGQGQGIKRYLGPGYEMMDGSEKCSTSLDLPILPGNRRYRRARRQLPLMGTGASSTPTGSPMQLTPIPEEEEMADAQALPPRSDRSAKRGCSFAQRRLVNWSLECAAYSTEWPDAATWMTYWQDNDWLEEDSWEGCFFGHETKTEQAPSAATNARATADAQGPQA